MTLAGENMQKALSLATEIHNDEVRAWKDEGGRVIGYSCVMTPIELIQAAGFLPYRLRALGNVKTEKADSYLSRFNCSFCRSCLELALDGTYDFLDGLVETNGCDHLRGMFENWQYAKKSEYFHYLKIPHVVNEDSLDYFKAEIASFRESLERYSGSRIEAEALVEAAREQEAVRQRIRKIYSMRERAHPAFSGYEGTALVLLSSAIPANRFLELADKIISERERSGITYSGARLMLCGAATDEFDLIKAIESLGAIIVTDSLCYGSRAFSRQIDPSSTRSGAEEIFARAYLVDLLCPRMFENYARRRDYVLSAVDRAKVDGVIAMHNKFCDVHGVDNVQLRIDLENRGIPVLQLEKEYGSVADVGRIKTRVQAFLERIGARERMRA